jgi:hypothetical protein
VVTFYSCSLRRSAWPPPQRPQCSLPARIVRLSTQCGPRNGTSAATSLSPRCVAASQRKALPPLGDCAPSIAPTRPGAVAHTARTQTGEMPSSGQSDAGLLKAVRP